LDKIAKQLKEEVDSLREYIQRTEESLLVTNWVGEMITPFEDTEREYDQEELAQIIGALYKARDQFSVNGHLAERLDAIFDRYGHLLADSSTDDGETQLPAKDPQNDNLLDFVEDEEEDNSSPPFEPFAAHTIAPTADPKDWQAPASEYERTEPLTDERRDLNEIEDDKSTHDSQYNRDNAVLDQFSKQQQDEEAKPNHPPQKSTTDLPQAPLPEVAEGELLIRQETVRPLPKNQTNNSGTPPKPRRDGTKEITKSSSKIRRRQETKEEEALPIFDIFSARISVEDLLVNMDIQLPKQDIVQLAHSLKHKLSSGVVTALQKTPQAKGQYVLIPRISRFIFDGNLYPCTVKNLARTYIRFFGDIQDLMQYKGMHFLNHDTPQLGWALVTQEAARETYDKNFMEQNQYLRHLSTSTGVRSHLVRRRTLVETMYDMIAGRLALNTTFLQHTLDWTSDGPNKSDYICAYFSDRGIRLRHLPRTQHNQALGLCPNW
jgi:hypothetical protein